MMGIAAQCIGRLRVPYSYQVRHAAAIAALSLALHACALGPVPLSLLRWDLQHLS